MKRLIMSVVGAVLALGVAHMPASAATITLDPTPSDDAGFFVLKGYSPSTFTSVTKFTLTQVADVTVDLFALGISNLTVKVCTTVTCASGSVVTPATSSLTPTYPLGSANFSYASLASGTNFFIFITGKVPFLAGILLGQVSAMATPLPASLIMFLTSMGGLAIFARRRKATKMEPAALAA